MGKTEMNKNLSIAELEDRMRPNSYSTKGFLGPNESLANVIQHDTQLLNSLNISHQQIADSLESVFHSALEQKKNPSVFRTDPLKAIRVLELLPTGKLQNQVDS